MTPEIQRHLGQLDRTQFRTAHNDSVYVQAMFNSLTAQDIHPSAFAYAPCWAILDAGMTVEPHQHAIPEFYVFVSGAGYMRIGDVEFPVENGQAVNIPPNMEHTVRNEATAVQPLIWVSIGMAIESKVA